jgi:hypothetical protein
MVRKAKSITWRRLKYGKYYRYDVNDFYATNENIVTDRTKGAKPARIPKENKQHRIISNLIKEPRFVLGMGFNKLQN